MTEHPRRLASPFDSLGERTKFVSIPPGRGVIVEFVAQRVMRITGFECDAPPCVLLDDVIGGGEDQRHLHAFGISLAYVAKHPRVFTHTRSQSPGGKFVIYLRNASSFPAQNPAEFWLTILTEEVT